MSAPDCAMTLDAARELLQEEGLRCTASRLAVLRRLGDSGRPVSHNEVADELEGEGFDRSTIYRCLMDLSDAGIAIRMDLGDHTWRFGLLRNHESGAHQHPHFLCVDCGQAVCLPGVEVRVVGPKDGGRALISDISEVVLRGKCATCG